MGENGSIDSTVGCSKGGPKDTQNQIRKRKHSSDSSCSKEGNIKILYTESNSLPYEETFSNIKSNEPQNNYYLVAIHLKERKVAVKHYVAPLEETDAEKSLVHFLFMRH